MVTSSECADHGSKVDRRYSTIAEDEARAGLFVVWGAFVL
jgi:hypothetical protein